MGFACKIAGHKWNGCTCTRCGERRDEGHDWQLVVKTGYPRSCKNKCSICGKEQPAEHDWNGCVCTRCGTTRSEGHILGRWERTNAESHARCCTVCGRARETEPHTFGPAAKCRRKCIFFSNFSQACPCVIRTFLTTKHMITAHLPLDMRKNMLSVQCAQKSLRLYPFRLYIQKCCICI